jgi:hypothetical protein
VLANEQAGSLEKDRDNMRLIIILVLAGLAAAGCAEKKDKGQPVIRVNPSYGLAAKSSQTYHVLYVQDVAIDVAGQPVNAQRTYEGTFTVRHDGETAEGRRATIRVDRLSAELVSSDGSEAFETGHIVGRRFDVTLDRKGGSPNYAERPPAVETGAMAGGDVDISFLFDCAFPRLPDGVLLVGNTWRVKSRRHQVEGIVPVSADLLTTHQLSGFETVDGVRCMKIDMRSFAKLEGGIADMEPPWRYRGTLRGSGTWYFALDGGSLVSLTQEEVTQGNASSSAMSTPIQQNTRIQVERVDK